MRDETKPMRILLCEDSLEGILTGVYEAYKSRYGHDNIKLCLDSEEYEIEMFSEYQKIEPDAESANKVLLSILEKIGDTARKNIVEAAYSAEADKAEVIYRYLIRGYVVGSRIVDYLSDPYVNRLFALCRRLWNEVHNWKEFLRFQIQENGLLTAVIEPKAKVLTFLMPHFADRLPIENFVIYDKTHDQAGIHQKQQGWFLAEKLGRDYPEYVARLEMTTREEAQMQDLWRIFFETIAIKERENIKLHTQLLPKWYREHMVEFH